MKGNRSDWVYCFNIYFPIFLSQCPTRCSFWTGVYGLQCCRLVHKVCLSTCRQRKVCFHFYILILSLDFGFLSEFICMLFVSGQQHNRGWSERGSSEPEGCCWNIQKPQGRPDDLHVKYSSFSVISRHSYLDWGVEIKMCVKCYV